MLRKTSINAYHYNLTTPKPEDYLEEYQKTSIISYLTDVEKREESFSNHIN